MFILYIFVCFILREILGLSCCLLSNALSITNIIRLISMRECRICAAHLFCTLPRFVNDGTDVTMAALRETVPTGVMGKKSNSTSQLSTTGRPLTKTGKQLSQLEV